MPSASPISVGAIANPVSGRGMRRVLAWARLFPTSEKVNVELELDWGWPR